MSDLELINKLIMRDESTLLDLIDIYGDLIYRASYKILNNKELSEECVNTVLLKIWEGIEYFDKDIGLFKNWIFTIAKYTAIDMLRKEVKHSNNNTELNESVYDKNSVEELILVRELINSVKKNVNTLNDFERKILSERFNKGNKVKDIAKSFGISPKALSLRIMRIKDKLKNN